MKSYLFFFLLLVFPSLLFAQNGNFTFGDISGKALYMKRYDKDTTANAVVLKEFGRTYIDNNQKNVLVHNYHVRIKILNEEGVDKANFVIPIRKTSGGEEEVHDIKGVTFNAGSDDVRLKLKNVFHENKSKYTDLVKFTMPNVKAGSVIEVEYVLSSPFIYNFRNWDFQSDIPKMYSEYHAKIPANLDYNISLIGYYKLTKNERSVKKNCLTTFNGGKADCTVLELGMKDVPAFKEEKYMTARSNFLSSVHFELSAIHRFNGTTDEVAKTWKDVDEELHDHKGFGIQLKKGESYFRKTLDTLWKGENDPLAKAKKVYNFLQRWYSWDDYTGMFCEQGIKQAFEARKGNIGDLNLSLIAALRAAGLDACPLLVSTRDNGLPHDIFPVISDFNYVLARLKTEQGIYFLDISRPELPFGVFPMDCINGKGRVLYNNKPSEWIPIKAPVIRKALYYTYLILDSVGNMNGVITRSYYGYSALAKRREMHRYSSKAEYLEAASREWHNIQIIKDSIVNLDDPDKPLIEKLTVHINGNPDSDRIIFNPFFQSFIKENPFKLPERHFPVDFGIPEQLSTVLTINYPDGYQLISSPVKNILALPDKGGRYVLDKDNFENSVIIKTMVEQSSPVYAAEMYPALKEFYNRIIQSQRAEIILSKN